MPRGAVSEAFRKVALTRPPLRTVFPRIDEEPRRRVLSDPANETLEFDAAEWPTEVLASRLADEAHRPFCLENGPVWRIVLFRRTGGTVLLFAIHHLVADMHSVGAVAREFGEYYTNSHRERPHDRAGAPDLPISRRRLARAAEYRKAQLPGVPPSLDLPHDFPSQQTRTGRGSLLNSDWTPGLHDAIVTAARVFGATPFGVLLAGYAALLYRWTGQRDILIGCPASRRLTHNRGELIGYQVTPVPLRISVEPALDFRTLAFHANRVLQGALTYRPLPQPGKGGEDSLRNPFQTMLVLYRGLDEGNFSSSVAEIEDAPFQLGGLACRVMPIDRRASLMDLRVEIVETAGTYRLRWEYATDVFTVETVQSIAASFEVLMRSALREPAARILSLEMLDIAQERKVLHAWNRTGASFPQDFIHSHVTQQVRLRPDSTAVVFEGEALSYGELDRRSNQLARRLQSLGQGPECFVGVLMERSLEAIISFLAVLKAGAALVPLDPSDPPARLAEYIAQANVSAVLCRPDTAPLDGVQMVRVDAADTYEDDAHALDTSLSGDSAAYLIFTSGSTGLPKGVINTHGGIHNRLAWMQSEYDLNGEDAVLQKTPFTFDVSIWEVFWPLMTGARLVLARPGGHRDPQYLSELIHRTGVTTLHFVPSMLQEFLSLADAGRLRSIRRMFSSGEELRSDLADRCLARIPARLYNLYGPTEAAIDVSHHQCTPMTSQRRTPLGRPIANMRLYIVDQRWRAVPPGMAGELCIGGVGLARGYAGRAALTGERFIPDPFSGTSGARLYRTGDLARYAADGTIEYLGRMDRQVKVAGVRVELEEIETRLAQHPAVRAAAARVDSSRRVCCYFVPVSGAEPCGAELRAFLAARLPGVMVPSRFARIDSLPLTTSGKLDRKALAAVPLPEPETTTLLEVEGALARRFLAICSSVLERADLRADETFVSAGGHSLDAIRVISRLDAEAGIKLPVEILLSSRTLAAVASELSEPLAPAVRCNLVRHTGAKTDIPLSYEQERLWVLDQLLPGCTAYNVDYAVRISGGLDASLIRRTLAAIIQRHEILRTTFEASAEVPVQRVHDDTALDFRYVDLEGLAADAADSAIAREAKILAQTPFDLAQLPLARFRVLRRSAADHVLLVSMHHIVTDGWSLGPLMRDFLSVYGALQSAREPALPPVYQYADYCFWQRERFTGNALDERLSYWTKRLAGISPTGIPPDLPRPPVQSFLGHELRLRLAPDLVERLEETAREREVTLFTLFLAAWGTLVHRWSGETDLPIATPVANRTHPDLENVVGFFVNTVILRLDATADPPFSTFLARVRETAVEAFDHADAPFEKVVEALQPERDLSRPPLFQSLFVFQNTPLPREPGALRFDPLHLETGNVRYDLRVSIEPGVDGTDAALQYNSDLFARSSAERMIAQFERVLNAIAADPSRTLSALPLVTNAERRFWRDEWNRTERPFAAARLETLFLEQAKRTPDAIAVISTECRLSYGDLEARSAAVAAILLRARVRPGELVAVVMEKGWEQVSAVLGILRAGAAYLPIDPAVPAARLSLLLSNAGVRIALTQSRIGSQLAWPDGVATVDVDGVPPCEAPVPKQTDISALAYVIYTSGSTGVPKGVMIDHRGAVNTILDINERYGIGRADRVLALSSLSFDLSVYDIFGMLAAGGAVVFPSSGLAADPKHWHQLLRSEGITIWNSVPMLMEMMLEHAADAGALESLRLVLLSGDWIGLQLPGRIRALAPAARVVSLGGATEASIWSILFDIEAVDAKWRSIPYGRPMSNQHIYVLDSHDEICPPGITGSIYIGGVGLALGYWGDDAKSHGAFRVHRQTGERIYRTGDIGRYCNGGYVELLGREDAQLKIAGSRVEPGEVETVLQSHPSVRHCVVTAYADGGQRTLRAFAVLHPGKQAEASGLLAYLREHLPRYMVPASVTILDRLPLNANGKVDARALSAAIEPRALPARGGAAGAMELSIASVVAEVLQVPVVDRHTNFFELGANSLLLVRARRMLEERLGRDLSMVDLFRHATVSALADYLTEEPATAHGSEAGKARAALRRAAAQRRQLAAGGAAPAAL